MSLLEKYEAAVCHNDIVDDSSQRAILAKLEKIANGLSSSNSWVDFLLPNKLQGLYIMGSVGVGKTYLMDLFYNNLSIKKKARFHFHHFMQQIDKKLRELQGHADPVLFLVSQLAKNIKVLCLDEFLVNDVAYAMILAQLLKALFKHNIILVLTTNTLVDDLYLDGVGRERFLPAIDLIKQHCEVVILAGNHDYRKDREHNIKSYLFPLNQLTNKILSEQFADIAKGIVKENGQVDILNRPISFVKLSKMAIWFEFAIICDTPRCQLDYLEIAKDFNTIFIANIPILTKKDTVRTLLFMHFVDVAYDRGMRLVISAEVDVTSLYIDGPLLQSFARTVSRLEEMQSSDYLMRHKYIDTNLELD